MWPQFLLKAKGAGLISDVKGAKKHKKIKKFKKSLKKKKKKEEEESKKFIKVVCYDLNVVFCVG